MHDTQGDLTLRRRAEKELATEAGGTGLLSEMSPEKMAGLIHDLQVHQVELKMQNDELRQIQGELEKTRDRYGHLYDFAPVGYFTVSQDGVIHEANLTIAVMLGIDRSTLIGQPFTRFLLRDDQDTFYKHQQRLLEMETPQSCELRLVKKDDQEFYARLECTVFKNKGNDLKQIRITASDVTDRKQAEEALLKAHYELELRVEERTAELAKTNHELTAEIDERKRGEDRIRQGSEFLKHVIDSLPHPFMVIDAGDYTIKLANSAASSGRSEKTLTCYALSHKSDKPCEGTEHACPLEQVRKTKKPVSLEHIHYDKAGNPRNIEVHGYPVTDDQGNIIQMIEYNFDITERRQAEELIKSSLKENVVLLSEVHHRVKNNMQVIISLLRLQSSKIEDKRYADMFKESVGRIRSIALIHEKLYQTKDFAKIDFNDYAKSLANQLIRTYSAATGKIKFNTNIEDIHIGFDKAIPCGLIINELISNSLKYAFPKGEEGEIKIVLRAINSEEVELTVRDDGIGISKEMDILKTESLGLQLVHILVEDQLDGSLEVDREGGTAFKIRFKVQ